MKAGNYDLKNLQIISETNYVDLSIIFREINIFESIYSPVITGYIIVEDANNLISGEYSIPIMGNEIIFIELNVNRFKYTGYKDKLTTSNTYTDQKSIKYYGRVTDIKNRKILNERSQTYEIHFMSEEGILDRNLRISKSFRNKTATDIVDNIFSQISKNTTYELEETVDLLNVVIPNWNPLKAINWIASRSRSATYNGNPTFFFFQTIYNDGPTSSDRVSYTKSIYKQENSTKFWFLSLDDMLAYTARKIIYFRPASIAMETIDDYSYSNASSYRFINSFNTLSGNVNGLFNSTFISHDITNKSWSKKYFNYDAEFDKMNHLENNKLYAGVNNINSKKFSDKDYRESKIIYDTTGSAEYQNHMDKIASIRNHRLATLDSFRLQLTVPGDGLLESGDIIQFDLPSTQVGGDNTFDKFYQGNYLIAGIRHHISRSSYNMHIECSKESLYKSV